MDPRIHGTAKDCISTSVNRGKQGDVRAVEIDSKWGSHLKSLGTSNLEDKKTKVMEHIDKRYLHEQNVAKCSQNFVAMPIRAPFMKSHLGLICRKILQW